MPDEPDTLVLTRSIARPRTDRDTAPAGYDPRAVAAAYGAPLTHYDGTGQSIGYVELGGALNHEDLAAAGLADVHVEVIAIDHAAVRPDPDADGEVMLDVEIGAAIAPGARHRVYIAPPTGQGFLGAVTRALAECDVVSISWGAPETSWPPRLVELFSRVFAAGRGRGVTVLAASGDTGSRDGTPSDVVDFPASDPNVIGCGGTRLVLDAAGRRASEVTWDDDDARSATGGGRSRLFPGRQVPDVAGCADPEKGYGVVVDGRRAVVGGTSAVAPQNAGCAALLRQALGRPFDLLKALGAHPEVCYDVTAGDNGSYRAGPGRDMTTGLGVVDWGKLLAVLAPGPARPPELALPLDSLLDQLGAERTDPSRGLVGVTATEQGLDQLRPVLGVEHREVDGAARITLTIGAP